MSALGSVRVLDLTRFLAGPVCTSILADLGADVVKVENPKGGDEGRYGFPLKDGVPIFFVALNRNKRGITLDLRQEEGAALFRRLLPQFDVLVENFAGGTLKRLGFDPEVLCQEHPRLIVASLSGFGQTGPWAPRACYDIITQAASGFMSLTGFPDNPPTRGGGSLGDYVQGIYGAIGVLGAIVARSVTGRGQRVDVSAQDAMFSLIDFWPSSFAATGQVPRRVGNRHLAAAPYDSFRARDGWVAIGVASNKLFRELMDTIGRSELREDPRFRHAPTRLQHADEICDVVARWVAERTIDEVTSIMEAAGIPCSPVYAPEQLLDHPQLLARQMLQRLTHPIAGEVVVPGVVPKLSDTPGSVRHLGPDLGEHNAEIYAELLGLGSSDLDRLRAAKII